MLPAQAVPCALSFDLVSAGRSKLARIAMIAMTTSSSINVNPSPVEQTPTNLRAWAGVDFTEGGRGQPHSKTSQRGGRAMARRRKLNRDINVRQVLECDCPLPLSVTSFSHGEELGTPPPKVG